MERDKRYKIIRSSKYTEGFANAFHISYQDSREYIDLFLDEETFLEPYEGITEILEDGCVSGKLIYRDEGYDHLRVVHARFKIPYNKARNLAKLILRICPEKVMQTEPALKQ